MTLSPQWRFFPPPNLYGESNIEPLKQFNHATYYTYDIVSFDHLSSFERIAKVFLVRVQHRCRKTVHSWKYVERKCRFSRIEAISKIWKSRHVFIHINSKVWWFEIYHDVAWLNCIKFSKLILCSIPYKFGGGVQRHWGDSVTEVVSTKESFRFS